jgi:hypothetical protein
MTNMSMLKRLVRADPQVVQAQRDLVDGVRPRAAVEATLAAAQDAARQRAREQLRAQLLKLGDIAIPRLRAISPDVASIRELAAALAEADGSAANVADREVCREMLVALGLPVVDDAAAPSLLTER